MIIVIIVVIILVIVIIVLLVLLRKKGNEKEPSSEKYKVEEPKEAKKVDEEAVDPSSISVAKKVTEDESPTKGSVGRHSTIGLVSGNDATVDKTGPAEEDQRGKWVEEDESKVPV